MKAIGATPSIQGSNLIRRTDLVPAPVASYCGELRDELLPDRRRSSTAAMSQFAAETDESVGPRYVGAAQRRSYDPCHERGIDRLADVFGILAVRERDAHIAELANAVSHHESRLAQALRELTALKAE
jgi:hypothetical protein